MYELPVPAQVKPSFFKDRLEVFESVVKTLGGYKIDPDLLRDKMIAAAVYYEDPTHKDKGKISEAVVSYVETREKVNLELAQGDLVKDWATCTWSEILATYEASEMSEKAKWAIISQFPVKKEDKERCAEPKNLQARKELLAAFVDEHVEKSDPFMVPKHKTTTALIAEVVMEESRAEVTTQEEPVGTALAGGAHKHWQRKREDRGDIGPAGQNLKQSQGGHNPKHCRVCKTNHGYPWCKWCDSCKGSHRPPMCTRTKSDNDLYVLFTAPLATECKASVNKKDATMALDSGCNMLAISEECARRSGCKIVPCSPIRARQLKGWVAITKQAQVKIGLSTGEIDKWVYVVESLPVDILAGTPWLFDEGRIDWRPKKKLIGIKGHPLVKFDITLCEAEGAVEKTASIMTATAQEARTLEERSSIFGGFGPSMTTQQILEILVEADAISDHFEETLSVAGQARFPATGAKMKPEYENENIWDKPRPMSSWSEVELKELRASIAEQLKNGSISELEPETDPEKLRHNYNLAMAMNAEGKFRMCHNTAGLNKASKDEVQNIPYMMDCLKKAQGAKYMAKFDFTKAYLQCKAKPSLSNYLVFTFEGKRYKCNTLVFGWKNSPARFQFFMDLLIRGIEGGVVYIDDIAIFSDTWESHIKAIRELFSRVKQFNLKLKPSKCYFGMEKMIYLGYEVTATGIRPDPERMRALAEFPTPENLAALIRFLAIASHYERFVSGLASMLAQMRKLANSKPRKWHWPKECDTEFRKARKAMSEVDTLAFFDPTQPTEVRADASKRGIGYSIMNKRPDNSVVPIQNGSRTLKDEEQRYHPMKRELLSVYEACVEFKPFLFGRPFILYTDSKPLLKYIKKADTAKMDDKTARMVLYLNSLPMEMRYLRGAANWWADGFSRAPTPVVMALTIMTAEKWASKQREDKECATLIREVQKGIAKGYTMRDGVLYKIPKGMEGNPERWQLQVPASMVGVVIEQFHEPMHWNKEKTKVDIAESYYWPKMADDVESHVQRCYACDQKRKAEMDLGVKEHIPTGNSPWSYMSMDTFGPLTTTDDNLRYGIVAVDNYSEQGIATGIEEQNAATFKKWFKEMIIQYKGIPDVLITDNGPIFAAEETKAFLKALGIEHRTITPENPRGNSKAERFVKTISAGIKANSNGTGEDVTWAEKLPALVLHYNNSIHSTTGMSPNMIADGRNMKRGRLEVPVDLGLTPEQHGEFVQHRRERDMAVVLNRHKESQVRNEREPPKASKEHIFEVGDLVACLKQKQEGFRKLFHPWEGPWKVTGKANASSYYIEHVEDGRKRQRHARKLKGWNQPKKEEPDVEAEPEFEGTEKEAPQPKKTQEASEAMPKQEQDKLKPAEEEEYSSNRLEGFRRQMEEVVKQFDGTNRRWAELRRSIASMLRDTSDVDGGKFKPRVEWEAVAKQVRAESKNKEEAMKILHSYSKKLTSKDIKDLWVVFAVLGK